MFFSRAALIVLSLAVISVLATPHALNRPHHRAIVARLDSNVNNNHTFTHERRTNSRCRHKSTSSRLPRPSSSAVVPSVTPSFSSSSMPPTPTNTSPPSNGNEPSFMSGTQHGDGTYFDTGLGACGTTNTDSDYIVAVAYYMFDNYPGYDGVNPNNNPICGKEIQINYQGKSVNAKIMDRCAGCMGHEDIDMTPTVFSAIADQSLGRIDISWHWGS